MISTNRTTTKGVPLLHDHILTAAAQRPSKVAVVDGKRRFTYAEINEQSNALAHALVKRGVERGDRVVVLLDNSAEAVIAFWAVLKANAIVSMVNPATKVDKLAFLLNDCRATALVTDVRLAGIVTEAAKKTPCLRSIVVAGDSAEGTPSLSMTAPTTSWNDAIGPETESAPPTRTSIDVDLASIIYTSGSTGEPKGVMLTHRNMLTASTSISTYLEIGHEDVILACLPMSFDYGLYQMIMAFHVGARIIVERGFSFPTRVLETVIAERVTGFPGVPTMFAMLAGMKNLDQFDLSNVKYVTNTAAALPVEHIFRVRDVFPKARVFSMYGLTECKRCTYLPPGDLERKPTSVGLPIPNTELWIVDEAGKPLPPNNVGQLVIRGATVMAGYWERPDETAKKLKPGPVPGEHVLWTGDLCRMDDEGYLYFVGRMDDVIKSRGEKVAPKEIETVLYAMPGVLEAAVVGVPDPILGQAPKAFVVLAEGTKADEKVLRRFCQERLEDFMVPKYFELRPSLPKTDNGKVDKRALANGTQSQVEANER